jgi:hypothetical protein
LNGNGTLALTRAFSLINKEKTSMRVITGLFDTRDQAHDAVDALSDAGIPSDDITLVGPEGDSGKGAAEGAGVGAAVGGVGGLLAGLGAFAIPGIGPVVGAGWLVATLVGAAAGGVAGGLIGSLTDAGVDERDAHVYAEGIRRGGTLVSARVSDEHVDAATGILGQRGAVDVSDRRREYEADGWALFDPLADPLADEEQGRRRPAPTIIPPLPR